MTSRLTSAPCVSAVSMAAKRARSVPQAYAEHGSGGAPFHARAPQHTTLKLEGRSAENAVAPSPLGGHQLATASVIAELATKFVRGRDNTFTSATSAQGAEAHA